MQQRNVVILSLKFVLKDLLLDILYWPIWWYSKGAKQAALFFVKKIVEQENILGVRIWIKNMFVPMFGQYDWQGRVISFFIRLISILARGTLLIFWAIICMLLFIAWLLLPIVASYKIGIMVIKGFIF